MDDLIQWHTVVRRREGNSYGPSSIALHPMDRMSHNAHVLCARPGGGSDMLVVFGGRFHLHSAIEVGVRRLDAPAVPWPPTWRRVSPGFAPTATLALNGSHQGCREERSRKDVIAPGFCEFDGRLAVVRFAQRYWLYARANLHPRSGARHVQVSSSIDGKGGWTPFELLTIHGVPAGQPESNIYFWLPLKWSDDVLLALLPAVLNAGSAAERRGGGIFWSASRDGVRWSKPRKLLESAVSDRRTDDYPVALKCTEGSRLCTLHVEHGVATIGTIHTRAFAPRHCEYELDRALLNSRVREALGTLEPKAAFYQLR